MHTNSSVPCARVFSENTLNATDKWPVFSSRSRVPVAEENAFQMRLFDHPGFVFRAAKFKVVAIFARRLAL